MGKIILEVDAIQILKEPKKISSIIMLITSETGYVELEGL